MNRTEFIRKAGIGGLVAAAAPISALAAPFSNDPQLDKEMVATFVGAAHRDMQKVQAMLEEHPTLLNAAHDWKFGDFETALGAASHVGYKELVNYLLDQGAQANIFTAALFGKLDIVKGIIDAFPNTIHAKGPHGFTLLHHAQRGGEEAENVANYLMGLGLSQTKIPLY